MKLRVHKVSTVLRKQLSVWSSPEIVPLWGSRGCRKEVVEKVMIIMLNFIKELLVCCITEVLKGREVWLTKSTLLVAPQERVDLSTGRRIKGDSLVIALHLAKTSAPIWSFDMGLQETRDAGQNRSFWGLLAWIALRPHSGTCWYWIGLVNNVRRWNGFVFGAPLTVLWAHYC